MNVGPQDKPRLQVRRYRDSDADAIRDLNNRLQAGGVHHQVYLEHAGSPDAGNVPPAPLKEREYVAAEGNEIRGGVWLREHDFWIGGQVVNAGWAKYPVAESLINNVYSGVPGSLIFQLLREQPRLMALGMGGEQGPFARLLARMGWKGETIPFLFKILKPYRVLRELRYARKSTARRILMDLGAMSGVGVAALHLYHWLRTHRSPAIHYVAEPVSFFGEWADAIWERTRDHYGFVARRDAAMLNRLYPEGMAGLTRIRVAAGTDPVGWVCTARFDFRNSPDEHFGRLVVGVLADGFAAPIHAPGVLAAGMAQLQSDGVDLVFSNQAHLSWINGLRGLGFVAGPSNFAFYRAPAADKLVADVAVVAKGFHVNRGDCDGPVWFS